MTALNNIKEKSWKVYLIIFMLYSVGGCIGEHLAYYFSTKEKLQKNPIMAGFPIYGLGAYLLVAIFRALESSSSGSTWRRLIHNVAFQFIVSAILLTALEYIGGKLVGAGKSNPDGTIETWDYTGTFLNYQGIINFKYFILHGILGVVVLQIHPYVVAYVNRLYNCGPTKNQ